LAEMGQVPGLLEGIVTWVRALRAKEPESAVTAGESARVNRTADALEVAVERGAFVGPINAAQIGLGVAVGLVEPRLPDSVWRKRRTGRSAGYDAIAARPSFQSTLPPSL